MSPQPNSSFDRIRLLDDGEQVTGENMSEEATEETSEVSETSDGLRGPQCPAEKSFFYPSKPITSTIALTNGRRCSGLRLRGGCAIIALRFLFDEEM